MAGPALSGWCRLSGHASLLPGFLWSACHSTGNRAVNVGNSSCPFQVRALDDGGVVFENNSSSTLGEALAALEEALVGRFCHQESASLPPSPTVEKTQRRPRSDA